jgi:hypothetical protein
MKKDVNKEILKNIPVVLFIYLGFPVLYQFYRGRTQGVNLKPSPDFGGKNNIPFVQFMKNFLLY